MVSKKLYKYNRIMFLMLSAMLIVAMLFPVSSVNRVLADTTEDTEEDTTEETKKIYTSLPYDSGIKYNDIIYSSLQARDEIDGYSAEPGYIEFVSDKEWKSIEYYILDTFIDNTEMVEALSIETREIKTSTGKSEAQFSRWTKYDPSEKPGLSKNMVNYIYFKLTDTHDNVTYISSKGIWEDENAPIASIDSTEPGETDANVVVGGEDEESGIAQYYLMVQERDKDAPTDPKTVIAAGTKSEDGAYKIVGLSEKTRYALYAVVEDKAGNHSPIKSGKITTEGDVPVKDVSSKDADTGKGDTTEGGSNVDKRTESVTTEEVTEVEPEPEKEPFIDYISGDNPPTGDFSGWEEIGRAISKSPEGSSVYVNMNGKTVVPKKTLEQVTDRNINVHFNMDEDVTVCLNGTTFGYPESSLNLDVTRFTDNIPTDVVAQVAVNHPRQNFTVEDLGTFMGNLMLEINLGEEYKEQLAVVYYYDPGSNSLVPTDCAEIDDTGDTQISFFQSGDYVIVISPDEGYLTTEEKPADDDTDVFVNKPKQSGAVWFIIVGIVGAVIILLIFLLPDKKTEKKKISNNDRVDKEQ